MLRRLIAVFLTTALLMPAAYAQTISPPELSAASAILVDGESGRVLFEKNARERRAIASITKLMTALVVVETGKMLNEEVEIKPEWTGIEGSSIYLQPGEKITLETLLYGLLLQSGNDAAVALAACCAGDVDIFVEMMNAKAKELGMDQTSFANPNGLSENGHYSSAYDMALLGRACLENTVLAEIMATKSITIGTRTFTNHNKLLWRYDGCTGMKTGYTEKSGRTLVSSAKINGQTLIAVTLNAPDDWNDHIKLFDYGYKKYPASLLCSAGKTIQRIPVYGSFTSFIPIIIGDEVRYPLAREEKVTVKIELPDFLEAPIVQGENLGMMSFFVAGELIAEANLLAGKEAHRDVKEPRDFLEKIQDWFVG